MDPFKKTLYGSFLRTTYSKAAMRESLRLFYRGQKLSVQEAFSVGMIAEAGVKGWGLGMFRVWGCFGFEDV